MKITTIGIVGYGYWGKIICENLYLMGKFDIIIYDPYIKQDKTEGSGLPIYKEIDQLFQCSHVFITSPASTHFDVCSKLLSHGISIFCEKPPTTESKTTKELYKIAKQNNGRLFIDWTFLYNDSIWELKKYIENEGLPKSIFMNRMNYGPKRDDVSAKYDLASHDISIINYLLGDQKIENIRWYEYNLINGSQYDTCIGIVELDGRIVQINTSWSANQKIRACYFNFLSKTALWDDSKKLLTIDSYKYYSKSSPLANSIQAFLFNEENHISNEEQQQITIKTMDMLEWK